MLSQSLPVGRIWKWEGDGELESSPPPRQSSPSTIHLCHQTWLSTLSWSLQRVSPYLRKASFPSLLDTLSPKGPRGLRYQSEAPWDTFPAFINIPGHLGHEAWESSTLGDHLGQACSRTDWETETPRRKQSALGPTEKCSSAGRAPSPALRERPACVGA